MLSAVWSLPVFRLVATDRCRVAAPWFHWSQSKDGTARLRRLALSLERNRLTGVTVVEQAAAAVAYLPVSLVAILSGLWKWGPALHRNYGVSLARQFTDLVNYSWRLGVSPRTYYHFRLHRHPWRLTGRLFIDQPELHHLQRHISPPDINALEDKVRFTARSRAHGLPLVPILALWKDGRDVPGDDGAPADGLPAEDLFIKPAASYSSAGVIGLRYRRSNDTYVEGDQVWTRQALHARLAASSRGRTLLVQPWMQNHPDLQGFSAEALCNIRIVTARGTDGTVLPVMAAFRFPWKSRVSSSEPGVTLCASIDLETGTMRAAEAKDPNIGRLTHHPITGQQIEGFTIKDWRALLAAAVDAHAAWPDFPFIGWDIVHTSRGIYILEGSCIWGGYLAQMSGSAPLGSTSFPAIYLAHLAARDVVPS